MFLFRDIFPKVIVTENIFLKILWPQQEAYNQTTHSM